MPDKLFFVFGNEKWNYYASGALTLLNLERGANMFRWAVTFFCLAAFAGFVAMSTTHAKSAELAQVASYVFLVAFLVLVVTNVLRGGAPK